MPLDEITEINLVEFPIGEKNLQPVLSC